MYSIVGIVITFLFIMLQIWSNGVYKRYSVESAILEYSGKDIVNKVFASKGITKIKFCTLNGHLNDWYDFKNIIFYMSKDSYKNTIASISIVTHEAFHAIQHNEQYRLLKIRKVFLLIAKLCARIVWLVILLGIILNSFSVLMIGFGLIGFAIICKAITLPVENDASKKAMEYLNTLGYDEDVMFGVKRVLNAKKYKYVVSSVLADVFFFSKSFIKSNN